MLIIKSGQNKKSNKYLSFEHPILLNAIPDNVTSDVAHGRCLIISGMGLLKTWIYAKLFLSGISNDKHAARIRFGSDIYYLKLA